MSSITSLEELYVAQLKDIYYAEKQLVKALGKMAKKATNTQLRDGFLAHLDQTEVHAERLEQIFAMLDMKPKAEKCEAITGIITEANELISDAEKGSVLDAALIFGGQKAEHYEIATYGCLATYAETLGFADQVVLLKKTLEEEKAADEKLTKLATSKINKAAASAANDTDDKSLSGKLFGSKKAA